MEWGPERFAAGLTSDELTSLDARGHRVRFAPGDSIISEGEVSRTVVVLVSGRVKLSSAADEGREVILGIRESGELLGELSAIDGGPRSTSVTALDPVYALIVGGEDFKSFLKEHPRVALLLLEMLVGRLRDADVKRIEMAAWDTLRRVASRLVEMVERFGEERKAGATQISLKLSQDELASWTGCSREAVAKALGIMRERGWVETNRKSLKVLDLEELKKRAQPSA